MTLTEKPPVWFWSQVHSEEASIQFYTIRDVPIEMRDGVVLRGDLYLSSACDDVVLEKYAVDLHTSLERNVTARTAKLAEEKYPCVLIRTPYNKSKVDPELRHPALYWVQHSYACFIQDVRGRFSSEGSFSKYVNEGSDGYDTVEWLSKQPWCNGEICTFGVSYLAHVQTSLACLNPPQLKAMFVLKGGFFDSFTSGIRQGGALEMRQWVWAIKHVPRNRKMPKQELSQHSAAWITAHPFKVGSSPLRFDSAFEKYMIEFEKSALFSNKWERLGLSIKPYLSSFTTAPIILLSGWYDIYSRSTVEMFAALQKERGRREDVPSSHCKLIMGPWVHTGLETQTAGEVDFGVQANLDGNIDLSRFTLARKWFDEFCTTPSRTQAPPTPLLQQKVPVDATVKGTNLSRNLPDVLYFRMGGGEGHITSSGCMYHGGFWLATTSFPPPCVKNQVCALLRERIKAIDDHETAQTIVQTADAFPLEGMERQKEHMVTSSRACSRYLFDPKSPFPSIGGNVFPMKRVLLPGAYNQIDRSNHFLCSGTGVPLSARSDVIAFRTKPLPSSLDVTGTPEVTLFVSSSCPDTDFVAMLVDEYPPSDDYPEGFFMNVTHGICRVSLRDGQHPTRRSYMKADRIYRVKITMYPTSNIFMRGHCVALYITSSLFPHYDINKNIGAEARNRCSTRYSIADNIIWHYPICNSYLNLPVIPAEVSPTCASRFVEIKFPASGSVSDEEEESEEEDENHN